VLVRDHRRGTRRRFAVGAGTLVDLLADARLGLADLSAARALSWNLPVGDRPVEAYVAEPALVNVTERYDLELDQSRSVPRPVQPKEE
jgi:hypothetical protein